MNTDFITRVVDLMRDKDFPIPSYVQQEKSAAYDLTGKSALWCSAVNSFADDGTPAGVRDKRRRDIILAAERYGILDDIKEAAYFVDGIGKDAKEIRSVQQWQDTRQWAMKQAAFMDSETKVGIGKYLSQKCAELGYVPGFSEKLSLDLLCERISPEVQEHIEKQASEELVTLGRDIYLKADIRNIPCSDLQEAFPAAYKSASLITDEFNETLFLKQAEKFNGSQQNTLKRMLGANGIRPVYSGKFVPYEISDEILAAL